MIYHEFKCTKQRLFDITITSLKNLKFDIIDNNFNNGLIIANTNIGFFTFGENININIDIKNTNITSISINSKSLFELQVIDWGKNSNNENRILENIKILLK